MKVAAVAETPKAKTAKAESTDEEPTKMAAKKKAKKTAPKMSKGEFVRSLPASTSAKKSVAKAREKGITLSESYFYKLNSTSGAKGKPSSVRRSRKTSGVNKTAWVLSQPMEMGPTEVAAKGKAAGISITPAYVSTIRSKDKREGGRQRQPGRLPKGATSGASKDLERAFMDAALALGLNSGFPRVQHLVEQVMTKVKALAV